MTNHQTPPSVTDEMVERAAKAVAAFLHAGEFQSPDQNWAQMSKHQKAQARALAQTVTAALAAMPGGVDVKPLDWQTTYVNRGDGQKEESGWEADNGFNQWYSVEMYFGADSYGWRVMFDCDVIADHDDPERAKAAAQEHFASRILSRLTPSAIGVERLDAVKIVRDFGLAAKERAEKPSYYSLVQEAIYLACEELAGKLAAPTPPTAQEG